MFPATPLIKLGDSHFKKVSSCLSRSVCTHDDGCERLWRFNICFYTVGLAPYQTFWSWIISQCLAMSRLAEEVIFKI